MIDNNITNKLIILIIAPDVIFIFLNTNSAMPIIKHTAINIMAIRNILDFSTPNL